MRPMLLIVIVVPVLAACSGGGKSGESAGDAVVRQLTFAQNGQLGRLWDEMYPAQQAAVPRQQYIDCIGKTGLVTFDAVKVIKTFTEPIDVHYVKEKIATSVTVEFRLGDHTERGTFQGIMVDGAWRFTLKNDADKLKAGEC